MKLTAVKVEDFVNYKKPSLFLGTAYCDFKCCREGGFPSSLCQNRELIEAQMTCLPPEEIYALYVGNDLTQAVVFGGLEPMLQFNDVLQVIRTFRENGCMDDFVIYTGYQEEELVYELAALAAFPNVVVKFGRYVPGEDAHMDEVLGVKLASRNQYAKRIS